MKWLAIPPILIALWFFWPKTKEPSSNSTEPKASTRINLDTTQPVKSEHESTIAEMAQWAANLSDEMLWQELQKSSEEYLAANKGKKWFDPPRLAVILAREHGKRHGEQGVLDLMSEYESHLSIRKSPEFSLIFNLSYASLSGWVQTNTESAVLRLIEIEQLFNPLTSDPEISIALLLCNRLGWHPIAPVDRILKEAFSRLAETNPNKTVALITKASVFIHPENVIGPTIAKLDDTQRRTLINYFTNSDHHSQFVERFPPELWTSDSHNYFIELFENAHPKTRSDLGLILAYDRPDLATELIKSNALSSDARTKLILSMHLGSSNNWLDFFDLLPRRLRFSSTLSVIQANPNFRHGPIDGRETGWIPNWDEYHETFIRVVRESSLPEEEKNLHLASLQKSWDRVIE